MCKRQDVRRSDSIVTSGKGSSAAVGCDIDRSDLPPLVVRNAPMFVILQVIFNQYASGTTSGFQKKIGYTAFGILSLDSATYPPR